MLVEPYIYNNRDPNYIIDLFVLDFLMFLLHLSVKSSPSFNGLAALFIFHSLPSTVLL